MVDGRYTGITTKTSRGSAKYKTLGDDLVALMAKQVKLTTKEFCALVECTLSGAAYVDSLRMRGEKLGAAQAAPTPDPPSRKKKP